MKKSFRLVLMTTTLLAGAAQAEDVTLTIESWRNDDLTIWQDKLIPAFEAANPGIKLVFAPTAPAEYNAALNSKLQAGSAGDLITCRPFDASLELYNQGNLSDLSGLAAMANFSPVAKSAWQTDDGSATFCVPMASVIHGFIYNKDIFKELGLEEPKTEDEFFAVLEKIKANGTYAGGTARAFDVDGNLYVAASLAAATGESLGTYRWIVWAVSPVSANKENTAYQEFAVELSR